MSEIMNKARRNGRRWRVTELLLVMVCLSPLLASGDLSAASRITVSSASGQSRYQIPAESLNGSLYISAVDIAEMLQARMFWSPEKKKIEMSFAQHTMIMTLDNPVIMVDRTAYQMPHGAVPEGQSLLVPLGPFLQILDEAAPNLAAWDEGRRQILLTDSEVNITDLAIEPKKNGTQITITARQSFPIEHVLDSSHWLTLTILGGRLQPELFTIPSPAGLLLGMKAFQFSQSCQISMNLSDSHTGYQVFQEDSPSRIVVLIRGIPGDAAGASSTAPDAGLKPNPDLAVFDLIVLDAGHGGKDPGAIGPSGLQEKDVVLDIALRLADLLRSRLGVQVILTRDDNTYIPLSRRTEIANSTGADLFVSVHANAARRRTAGGFETFFLSPAKNDEARAVAMQENASLKFEEEFSSTTELSDEDFVLRDIVNDMLQSSFLKESEDLAATVQEKMGACLDISDRGIDQAGFFVLVGAKMPAVLIETAFISNPHEEKLLKKNTFRQTIAEAIFEGIRGFKTKYESKM